MDQAFVPSKGTVCSHSFEWPTPWHMSLSVCFVITRTARPRNLHWIPYRHRRPGPRAARLVVLLAAFVCAACGLVYELELVALGSYLLGDSVTQASVVLSVMVFAMGIGSLLAKRFTASAAVSFAVVEGGLALSGGLSVLALYAGFVWVGHYGVALVGFALLIGMLTGAEIPLLLTLIQRIRRQDAGRAAADLFAADYVGALVGGLAFPFLLLPLLGQATGALLTGAVNALAGAVVVLWLFREESPARVRLVLWVGCGAVLAALALAAALTGVIERAARHALYGAPVRFSAQTRFQDIVLTGPRTVRPDATALPGEPGPRLYLGGTLTLCGADQARYRAALVDPALAGDAGTGGPGTTGQDSTGQDPTGQGSDGQGSDGQGSDGQPPGGHRPAAPGRRVLVLGGGDGLAAREALNHGSVAEVTLVEQDPELLWLSREDPALAALNGGVLDDPRLRVVNADVLDWLRDAWAGAQEGTSVAERFDTVIADLPAPDSDDGTPYYSEEFYGLVAQLLAPGGRLAVAAGPPAEQGGDRFWTVAATLHAAGLRTAAYAVPTAESCGGPGEWGFLLAARATPRLALPPTGRPLLAPQRTYRPSTLLHPVQ
jgi:spermidine synthase